MSIKNPVGNYLTSSSTSSSIGSGTIGPGQYILFGADTNTVSMIPPYSKMKLIYPAKFKIGNLFTIELDDLVSFSKEDFEVTIERESHSMTFFSKSYRKELFNVRVAIEQMAIERRLKEEQEEKEKMRMQAYLYDHSLTNYADNMKQEYISKLLNSFYNKDGTIKK